MIKITAEFLINRRKMQWESHHDIRKDEYFVKGVAYEITQNDELREEIIDDPSKLIELCFTVVNKDKKVGRNDPCPCGSGKKYKYCCGMNEK